jgi:hypothetical protein
MNMRKVNGTEKLTETEAREIVKENGLEWDRRSELFNQCTICGAYVEVAECPGERPDGTMDTCDDCHERIKAGQKDFDLFPYEDYDWEQYLEELPENEEEEGEEA